MRVDDKTIESTGITVKDTGNQELVDALTLGDGPMAAGFQPGMQTASEAGKAALAEALQVDDSKVDKKKVQRPKPSDPEPAKPKSLEEFFV